MLKFLDVEDKFANIKKNIRYLDHLPTAVMLLPSEQKGMKADQTSPDRCTGWLLALVKRNGILFLEIRGTF